MDLKQELESAIKIVKEAGKILIDGHPNPSGIETKADGSLVSDVDRKASAFIQERLIAGFPSYAMVNEELAEDQSRFKREFCWFVDPLDDTKGFLAKSTTSGILLGLTYKFQPVLGVTYNPFADELVCAIIGNGTYCMRSGETSKISVSKNKDIHLLISSSRSSPELEQIIAKIRPARTTKMGGSLKIVEVAKGFGNVFYCPKSSTMHLWDLCGPSVILEEAGGKITDTYGKPFDYSQKDTANVNGVIATNGVLHPRILSA